MCNRVASARQHRWLVGLVLVFSLQLKAAPAPAPSQDFWDYMNDFSDENGELVDPQDVDDMLGFKENEEDLSDEVVNQNPGTARQPASRWRDSVDARAKKSSGQASSSAISGAKL